MNNPLKPSAALLIKLGSALIHAEEIFAERKGAVLSENAIGFDLPAFETAAQDPEVVEWIAAMDKMAFLPRKR